MMVFKAVIPKKPITKLYLFISVHIYKAKPLFMARNKYKKINFITCVKACALFESLNTKNLLPKKEEVILNIYPIKFENP